MEVRRRVGKEREAEGREGMEGRRGRGRRRNLTPRLFLK